MGAGYGVVGDPFVGGAAGFGGAVVFHSFNAAALRIDDKRPRARRVHGFADPAGRVLSFHLFVDFFVMQEGACPVCRQDRVKVMSGHVAMAESGAVGHAFVAVVQGVGNGVEEIGGRRVGSSGVGLCSMGRWDWKDF